MGQHAEQKRKRKEKTTPCSVNAMGCPSSWDSTHMDDDLQTSSSLHISWGPFVVIVQAMDAEQAQMRHHACPAGTSVALRNALWQV